MKIKPLQLEKSTFVWPLSNWPQPRKMYETTLAEVSRCEIPRPSVYARLSGATSVSSAIASCGRPACREKRLRAVPIFQDDRFLGFSEDKRFSRIRDFKISESSEILGNLGALVISITLYCLPYHQILIDPYALLTYDRGTCGHLKTFNRIKIYQL